MIMKDSLKLMLWAWMSNKEYKKAAQVVRIVSEDSENAAHWNGLCNT